MLSVRRPEFLIFIIVKFSKVSAIVYLSYTVTKASAFENVYLLFHHQLASSQPAQTKQVSKVTYYRRKRDLLYADF